MAMAARYVCGCKTTLTQAGICKYEGGYVHTDLLDSGHLTPQLPRLLSTARAPVALAFEPLRRPEPLLSWQRDRPSSRGHPAPLPMTWRSR